MSLPADIEYETYEVALAARWDTWVECMCGRLEAVQSISRWPKAPKHTQEPRPLAVWHNRPADISENAMAPDVLWSAVVNIEDHGFYKGSGRSVLGKNAARHGRLNYEATMAAVQAWRALNTQEGQEVARRILSFSTRLADEALARIPSVDDSDTHPYGGTVSIKVIRFPTSPAFPDSYACGVHANGPVGYADMSLSAHRMLHDTSVDVVLAMHNFTPECKSRILAKAKVLWG